MVGRFVASKRDKKHDEMKYNLKFGNDCTGLCHSTLMQMKPEIVMNEYIIYEQPVTENIRNFLKCEYLFEKFNLTQSLNLEIPIIATNEVYYLEKNAVEMN